MSEKMLPDISVNKGCCSHQVITLQPHPPHGEPRESSGEKEDAGPQAISLCSHPSVWYPEETQDEKVQNAGPR